MNSSKIKDISSGFWIKEALSLPLRFAQVREDPSIDLELLQSLPASPNILMVASGGCTASYLAPHANSIHCVDPNPSQLVLTQLKLNLLENQSKENRLRILGHQFMDAPERSESLKKILSKYGNRLDDLGPADLVTYYGPDLAGRYERIFAQLQYHLLNVCEQIEFLIQLKSKNDREQFLNQNPELVEAIRQAFTHSMPLDLLIEFFGEAATQNRRIDFHEHFINQTLHALIHLSPNENPYLYQVLLGRYRDGFEAPWFDLEQQKVQASLNFSNRFMDEVLEVTDPESIDYLHLSNILDWLDPQRAELTLELAYKVLKPGGIVCIRQLNSTLDIPRRGQRFYWDFERAESLLAKDLSYFYRALHVGLKR